MSDDPKTRQDDQKQSVQQTGQKQQGQQSDQQQNTGDSPRKNPSPGGTDVGQDQRKQDQGGQRRAS